MTLELFLRGLAAGAVTFIAATWLERWWVRRRQRGGR